MNNKHTKIIFYLSIITTLLAVGAFIFLFKIIINKNEHTSVVMTTLSDKMIKKQNNKELTNKLTEIDNMQKTIDGYFVDPNHIDSFIEYLEKIGAPFGVTIKVENFEISLTEKNILVVELSSKGTFTNMMRIIKLIENAPYQTHVKKVSLVKLTDIEIQDPKAIKETSGNLLWQVNIIFSILTSAK